MSAPFGERDTKLTDHRELDVGPKHKSLYIGLLYNIVIGLLLGLLVWGSVMIPSYYIINHYYVTEKMQQNRREEYLVSLQKYVSDNNISLDESGEITEWVRNNPYVYLLVYQGEGDKTPSSGSEAIAPGAKDKLTEHSGARVDESLERNELIASARSHGYTRLDLEDGSVIVAITEYTENLFYTAFSFISILAAALTFVLMLVRYIRILIERVKRFESDITIVSEIDMNYEIMSEGVDELSNLSHKVETMRQTMLDHIKSEQEAREANTELITSISHDIRTPLTVIMGYIEMMKSHVKDDEAMASYVSATESTALRLKQLSDDMFKYSLLFGDTDKIVKMEEYDAVTLFDQILTEHILLMRERGYDIISSTVGEALLEGSVVNTDPQNLMRIIDNIFSNMSKYADKDKPIYISCGFDSGKLIIEFKNSVRHDNEGAESNGIGIKTCLRLGKLVADKFEYENDGEMFTCRLYMNIKKPKEV